MNIFEKMKGAGDLPAMTMPNEFASLHPDHILLENFQNNVKEFYQKQLEEARNELNGLEKHLKSKTEYHNELEKKLERQQDELMKYKKELENLESLCSKINKSIETESNELKIISEEYNNAKKLNDAAKAEEEKLQIERKNLEIEVARLEALKEITYSEKDNAQCVAKRVGIEKSALKSENYQIDMLISNLQEHLLTEKEKANLFKAQCSAQQEELSTLKDHVIKTKTEIKTILLDNKNLLSMWKNILNVITEKSIDIVKIQELIKEQQGKILTGNAKLNELKNRSIRKELEKNEYFNLTRKQILSKLANKERNKEKHNTELQNIMADSTIVQKTICELEKQVDLCNGQLYVKDKINANLRNQVQIAASQCKDIKKEIMTILEETFFRNNVFKSLNQKLTSLMEQLLEQTNVKTETENEMSKLLLEVQNVNSKIHQLQLVYNEQIEIIDNEKNKLAENEKEIWKNMKLSSTKQNLIATLTKKLEDMISLAGGVELGPLEREIENFKRDICILENKYLETEKLWKNQQNEMINMSDEIAVSLKELSFVNKEIAVLGKQNERLNGKL
ncbi:coiled-coil domain-containing protein 40-like [Centruroides sculpturatus]|uniref:coiled-coil domain-containing protein 40-like n=1 Tax=Centruroides sculpturatus TaxID=218467 RepID=UPI000C6D96FD|nr:coiled-coil domain-containing protein 40-like [Centruroides sculpturatus]